MKTSELKLIIKEIVKTVLKENVSDPTKEEMLNYLRGIYGKEEGFKDDAEVAMFWFAYSYHGGQGSDLYSVLSTSHFNPGPISKGPEKDTMEEDMYEALVVQFAPDSKEAKEFKIKYNSLNEELSQKNRTTIEKWCKELGFRNAGVKMIDVILSNSLMGLTSAALPDTSIFANGLDDIEVLLKDGNYEAALRRASETAKEMVEEEGGEGLMETGNIAKGNDDKTTTLKESDKFDIMSQRDDRLIMYYLVKKFESKGYKPEKGVQGFETADKVVLKKTWPPEPYIKGTFEYIFIELTNKKVNVAISQHPTLHREYFPFDKNVVIKYPDKVIDMLMKYSNAPKRSIKESLNQLLPSNVDEYKELKRLYNKAIKSNKSDFTFKGTPVLTDYVRYVLEYLKPKFGGIKEETEKDEDALYVEFVKDLPNEKPFTVNGEKFQYVMAKYPSGKQDIGVYATRGDLVYGYNAWKKRYNIQENFSKEEEPKYYREHGVTYCHIDPKKESCPPDMKIFSYTLTNIPKNKKFERNVCCYNSNDFYKLMSIWNLSSTWKCQPNL